MDSQKRIFITGGASGLGKALAERFAREGWKVCIGDISEARGKEVAQALRQTGATAEFIRCDVTREEDLKAVLSWLETHWGGLDILVNNAGVAVAGEISSIELKDWQWLLDINLLGVVRGCRVFIPLFKKQGSGHIVNIASLAGLIHPPRMSPYNAAKAGVVALSETIHFELKKDKIDVSVVCPSFFKTNLTETSRVTDPQIATSMKKLVDEASRSANQIADAVYHGVLAKKFVILTEAEGKLVRVLKRILPFGIYSFLVLRRSEKMQKIHL